MTAFPKIKRIIYEGPASKNPLAFRHYNADEVVEGKSMRDHLRFSVVYWHTFRGPASRSVRRRARRCGPGTTAPIRSRMPRTASAWRSSSSRSSGLPTTPFTIATSLPRARRSPRRNKNLDAVVKVLKRNSSGTGIKLLWGTANLFSNPRYMHGAATSPNAEAFAFAAAQVKKALEVTHELGGEGYMFWGGREGYQNLWNTDMKRELDHLARFLHMAVDYAKEIGFTGQFYIEPKPKEPTKHQYDFDAAACLNFLRQYDLTGPPQAEPRNQPRHARRPHDAARAGSTPARPGCSARSTPTRATCCWAGTPTSSRPTSISRPSACTRSSSTAGSHRAA